MYHVDVLWFANVICVIGAALFPMDSSNLSSSESRNGCMFHCNSMKIKSDTTLGLACVLYGAGGATL